MNQQAFGRKWINTWNSHQLDDILAMYAPDIQFQSPKVIDIFQKASGQIDDKKELGRYFQLALKSYPDLYFELYHILEGLNSLVIYYKSIGNSLSAEFMELDEQGQIKSVRAHYFPAPPQQNTFFVTALLYAQPGQEKELAAYEDQLLKILQRYKVNIRLRYIFSIADSKTPKDIDSASELHLLEFPGQAAFEKYLADPERQRLKATFGQVLQKSLLIKGHIL